MRRRIAVGVALIAAFVTGCGSEPVGLTTAADKVILRPVPPQIGDLRFQRESGAEKRLGQVGDQSLLRGVEVFTARNGDSLLGYLEIGEFKDEYPATRPEVRQGVLDSLGGGKPQPIKLGPDVVFSKQGQEQRFLIWFSPGGRYFEVLVAGRKLADPERLFASILAAQAGRQPVSEDVFVNRFDPRRGGNV